MGFLSKLKKLFGAVGVKKSVKANYDLSSYLNNPDSIKLNYTYELISTRHNNKYNITRFDTIKPEMLNDDISTLRNMSNSGITTINIKLEDVRGILAGDNKNCLFNDYSGMLVYKDDNRVRHYKSADGKLEAWLSDSIQVPTRMITVDCIGNMHQFLFGSKEQNIKQVELSNKSLLVVGEYFGIIRNNETNSYEYAYAIIPIA